MPFSVFLMSSLSQPLLSPLLVVERSSRVDCRSLSLWSKSCQAELLPVENEDREDVESCLVEKTSGDEALGHAVQYVDNQLLRDIDLYKG